MSDELAPGDRFADYSIVRTIGMGGMGRVYEAEHMFTGRRVALKIMHSRHAQDPELLARAIQEARATAELRHKNIVTLESANITADGLVWIATEYLEGQTLRQKLDLTRRLGLDDALSYLIEICDGVAAAHDIGILHRDLKPENVFVTSQNAVKLLDFGAAKAPALGIVSTTEQLAQRGGVPRMLGTPAYIAPEQARGGRAGLAADIYGIGLLGYHLLAHRHPFAEPDGRLPEPFELNRRHIEEEPPSLRQMAPHVPDFVESIVRRALDKDPAKRPPSAGALAGELRAARGRARDERGVEARKPFAKQWTEPGSWAAHGPAFDLPARTEAPAISEERLILAGGPARRPVPGGENAAAEPCSVAAAPAASRVFVGRRRAAAVVALLLLAAAVAAGALAAATIVTQP